MKAISIKVVIVCMFDDDDIPGENLGELHYWKKNLHLDKQLAFSFTKNNLFLNENRGVIAITTGMGSTLATAAIMALGLDERFDFRQSYWLVAGVAGGNPHQVSLGSVVWSDFLVDGDLCHQIDNREIPANWPSGIFPLFSKGPEDVSNPNAYFECYQLNTQLLNWAFQFTASIQIKDSVDITTERKGYKDFPAAQQPPAVVKGSQLCGKTYWHGKLMNQWATDWVRSATHNQGQFFTSGMEDSGSFLALSLLTQAKKADLDRFMILRAVSNYTFSPASKNDPENFFNDANQYAGMAVALKGAYDVGSKVVNHIVENWDTFKNKSWH